MISNSKVLPIVTPAPPFTCKNMAEFSDLLAKASHREKTGRVKFFQSHSLGLRKSDMPRSVCFYFRLIIGDLKPMLSTRFLSQKRRFGAFFIGWREYYLRFYLSYFVLHSKQNKRAQARQLLLRPQVKNNPMVQLRVASGAPGLR